MDPSTNSSINMSALSGFTLTEGPTPPPSLKAADATAEANYIYILYDEQLERLKRREVSFGASGLEA
jgi:hypothetical protein